LRGQYNFEELHFPGEQKRKKPMSNMTILKALERMGYDCRMTGRGFRGLASTILREQAYNQKYIELQLVHAPHNKVSAAFNHALYLEPRARMMQDWADFLKATLRSNKVLPFPNLTAAWWGGSQVASSNINVRTVLRNHCRRRADSQTRRVPLTAMVVGAYRRTILAASRPHVG